MDQVEERLLNKDKLDIFIHDSRNHLFDSHSKQFHH